MGDAEKNSPMDGAFGGTYCAPMWAKFFAAALKDQPHPGFAVVPVDLQPVARQDAGHVAVGVAVVLRQRFAVTGADEDDQADASTPTAHADDAEAHADDAEAHADDAEAHADAHAAHSGSA